MDSKSQESATNSQLNPDKEASRVNFGIGMAVVTALSWGLLAIALKYALRFASPGTVSHLRFVVAAFCVFFLIKKPFGPFLPDLKMRRLFVFSALCLALNYFAFMKGVQLTSASFTQVLIQTGPLSLFLTGLFFFRETVGRVQIFGLLTTILGFSLFFQAQNLNFSFGSEGLAGAIWIIAAALVWAIFAAIQKFLSPQVSALQMNLWTYVICAIALTPVADFQEWLQWSLVEWLILIGLGLNTVVAYGCLNSALKYAPASRVSVIITCNPIITLVFMNLFEVWGWEWLQPEPLSFMGWVGAIMVISGVIIAQTKKARQG